MAFDYHKTDFISHQHPSLQISCYHLVSCLPGQRAESAGLSRAVCRGNGAGAGAGGRHLTGTSRCSRLARRPALGRGLAAGPCSGCCRALHRLPSQQRAVQDCSPAAVFRSGQCWQLAACVGSQQSVEGRSLLADGSRQWQLAVSAGR